MATQIRKRTCKWPRFSRYEFLDDPDPALAAKIQRGDRFAAAQARWYGRICPAAGAKIHRDDLWDSYVRSKEETRGQPPYMSLLSLVDRLEKEFHAMGFSFVWTPKGLAWKVLDGVVYLAGGPPAPSEESINAIVAWTCEHGLLGVFHQTIAQIEDPASESTWTRVLGCWDVSYISSLRHDPQDRTCLTNMMVASTLVAPANPLITERQSARSCLRRFCPQLNGEMPAPDSEEFFALYSESLWDWVVAARTTVQSILARNEEVLNILAGAAARTRWFEDGRVRSQIVFPSLLSAFAEMAFQDFEGEHARDGQSAARPKRIGQCARCGEWFTTDRDWATYCSPGCATKERQRRFLEKNPEYHRRRALSHPKTESKRGKAKKP
jgi:hypothetical protein